MDIGGKALIRKYLNKRVLSIKKSLIYYIVISSLLSVIISKVVKICAIIIKNIKWSKYKKIEEYNEIFGSHEWNEINLDEQIIFDGNEMFWAVF